MDVCLCAGADWLRAGAGRVRGGREMLEVYDKAMPILHVHCERILKYV